MIKIKCTLTTRKKKYAKLTRVFQKLGLHALQSNQVKRTPQEAINEFIIQKLNPLLVVDFRLISAFLHVKWAVNSHARQLWNFHQLLFPEFDVNVF